MEASGSHGRGGLLVQESNEAPPNGTRGVTECAGHDETDEVGVRVEPEVVLPAQVFDRRADLLQPEKRLMLAILEDATATLLRHPTPRHAGKRRALRETEAWLDSPDTESPFAFIRICEALGLDAQWLRRGLARAQVAREGEPGKDGDVWSVEWPAPGTGSAGIDSADDGGQGRHGRRCRDERVRRNGGRVKPPRRRRPSSGTSS